MHTPCLTLAGASCGALLAAVLAAPAYAAVVGPVAHDDSYNTAQNTNLVIGAPGVLSNDTDAAGGALTASPALVSGAQHGSVSLSPNGAFTYVPTTNYVGPDQFTYTATAADGTDTATVFITVKGTAPAPTTTTEPPPVGGGVVIYPTCAAALAAGVHDIPRSDPRYRLFLDRDRDGIACELNEGPAPITVVKPPPSTTVITQPPATNTIVQPSPTIIVPPAQPPANTFTTPQAPSSGAVATGDGSMAGTA